MIEKWNPHLFAFFPTFLDFFCTVMHFVTSTPFHTSLHFITCFYTFCKILYRFSYDGTVITYKAKMCKKQKSVEKENAHFSTLFYTFPHFSTLFFTLFYTFRLHSSTLFHTFPYFLPLFFHFCLFIILLHFVHS